MEKELVISQKANNIIAMAQYIADHITDDASAQIASNYLKENSEVTKEVKTYFNPDRKKAKELLDSLTEKFNALYKPLTAGKEIVKEKLSLYFTARDQAAEIETERRIAATRMAAEAAKLSAAEEARASGDHERAAAILEQPLMMSASGVVTQRIDGLRRGVEWNCEITNLELFLQDIMRKPESLSLICVNQIELDKMVNILKTERPYAGVRAWQTQKVSSTGR